MYQIIPQKIDKKVLKNITFLIIYSFFAFFFLINGSGLFSEWETSWTTATMVYLIGVAVFLVASEKLPKRSEKYIDKEFEAPLTKSLIGFCFAFAIATLLFIVIKDLGLYFRNVVPMPVHKIPATLAFQLVIVCASEEIIFRGITFRWLYIIGERLNVKYGWLLAWLGSAFIFAIFHWTAYGGAVENLLIAFLMGVVLAWAVDRWNLGVSAGIHFAWNAFVLGATALL